MHNEYSIVNIREYLDINKVSYIGEEGIKNIFSDFSCPKNPDVEYFLLHNAIEFTKKDQSITYLVFDNNDGTLVGYFSITIKPISILASKISKTNAKKLSRISFLDENTKTYTTSVYLIAQLGKNYSISKERQIAGKILLDFALKIISDLKYSIGGLIVFLECLNEEFLLNFYKQNNFIPFDTRETNSRDKETLVLHQFLRFI